MLIQMKQIRKLGTDLIVSTMNYFRDFNATFLKGVKTVNKSITKTFISTHNSVSSALRNGYSMYLKRKRIIERKKKRSAKKAIIGVRPSLFYKLKYVFIGILMSFLFIFLPMLVVVFIADLPTPNNLSATYIPKTTKIFDRKGNLLYEFFANQNRTLVKLDDIPRTSNPGWI